VDSDTLYLYNSGYDPKFASLSAGQVCTFLTIQAGIASGLKCYNFLKGNEVYKKRLGGRPVQLVRLRLKR
jgi:CelD/BcsL family acetyltransferase involved in cellulose biosynthesis